MSAFYGALKSLAEKTIVDKSINDLYPKEYHGVLKLPNGKFAFAQYMGPGTRLDKRIPAGQDGLTPIDKESKAHDIRYNLAMNKETKEETQQAIREADDIFNKVIDRLRKDKKESEFNLKQAELIKAKVFLEGNSVLRDWIYNFNTRKTEQEKTPELEKMFESELKKLEQQGYGSYNEEDFLKKADKYFPDFRKWYMANKKMKGGCNCQMYGSGVPITTLTQNITNQEAVIKF